MLQELDVFTVLASRPHQGNPKKMETLILSTMKIEKKKRRKTWMKEYLKLREKLSNIQIPSVLKPGDIRNWLRVGTLEFQKLLNLVTPFIKRQDTLLKQSVSAKQRLVVTLRFLATGDSYQNLRYSSLISRQLLSRLIPETCRAIYKCLRHYIKMPKTETEWKEVAELFEQRWDFNHCVGSCDGKHIAIKRPHENGSMFRNYKGFFSIVLFAVVNANYEFMYVNTGTNGSTAVESILNCTRFYQKMIDDDLNLPPACALPGTDTIVPYVFLGGSGFQLNENFMTPFHLKNIDHEQQIFNYRLSRARRVVENTLGILASRFRVLRGPLSVDLDTVNDIVVACCALHNYLIKNGTSYLQENNVDHENTASATYHQGDWRTKTRGFTPLQHIDSVQGNDGAAIVRNKYKDYFISEGTVPFQDKMMNVVPIY